MRLLLNSHPKSGGTYFYTILMAAARYPQNPDRDGEYSNSNDWVINSHEPLLLLSKIPGISQITIIRNPLDVLASNIFRHTSGLNSNSIWGHTGVSTDLREYDFEDPRFIHAIKHASLKWKEYIDNTINNKENLICFEFESIVNNTDKCIKHVFMKHGASKEQIDCITEDFVSVHKEAMGNVFALNPNHNNGTDNRLPLGKSKPKGYYEIRKELKNGKYYDELMSLYSNAQKTLFSR